MSFETFRTFFALLSLLATIGAVIGGVLLLRALATPERNRHPLFAAIEGAELKLAFVVALTATLGSLYLSEVAHLEPCRLCWYQRIAMYPLALILGIAAWRRDTNVRPYALSLAIAGGAISTYHYALQRFPSLDSGACDAGVPCSAAYFWEFGFMSIPYMALSAFALVAVLLGILWLNEKGGSAGLHGAGAAADEIGSRT